MLSTLGYSWLSTFLQMLEKPNVLILRKEHIGQFWTHFPTVCPNFWQMRIFGQKK